MENSDFEKMSVAELSNFIPATNVILNNNDREGIMIGLLDLEEGKNAVKVIADRKVEYWPTDGVEFVRTEPRRWE